MSASTALRAARFYKLLRDNPLRTAGGVGLATGLTAAALSPTTDSDNNKGNQAAVDQTTGGSMDLPPGTSSSTTPEASADKSKTPPITDAGKTDFLKDLTLKELLALTEATGERATERNVRAQLILNRAAEEAALRKSRELSAREIEKANINAWRDITAKQYEANAAIGLGMAEIAYRATQANPGVLAATQQFARTGMEAFKGG